MTIMFPKLKTDAVAQYPLTRRIRFQNQALTFVDGTQQRYRDGAGARMKWEIRLAELDEGELAALEEFVMANQGAFGSFAFTDPRDGQVYDDCSLGADGVDVVTVAEMRCSTTLTVEQNRK
jgi:phage-related protein